MSLSQIDENPQAGDFTHEIACGEIQATSVTGESSLNSPLPATPEATASLSNSESFHSTGFSSISPPRHEGSTSAQGENAAPEVVSTLAPPQNGGEVFASGTHSQSTSDLLERATRNTIEIDTSHGLTNHSRHPALGSIRYDGRWSSAQAEQRNAGLGDQHPDHFSVTDSPCTDAGNAIRMATHCGNEIRYVHPWGKWLVWDGQRWKVDDTGAILEHAKNTAWRIVNEAGNVARGRELDKELLAWCLKSQSRQRLEAMIFLARSVPNIHTLPCHLDQHPWLLNCRNGTIDLETGELKPHDKADMLTQLAPVDFDPAAVCPQWEATVAKFLPSRCLQGYFQRLCGYAITGVVQEHILPIAYGHGANGKSTLLGALLDVLGSDYSMKGTPELLLSSSNNSHPTGRADLFGKRLVLVNETGEGRHLDEALVKELTGGDKIRARRMREDHWEFVATHTLILATNHLPEIRGTDKGIWRRIQFLPFTVTVDGDEAVKEMPARLRGEASGILAWLVRGCRDWQAQGLNPPPEVTEATQGYREAEDILGAFIAQKCLVRMGAFAKTSEVYARYKEWAVQSGHHALNLKQFSQKMKERGFTTYKASVMFFRGVSLLVGDVSLPPGRRVDTGGTGGRRGESGLIEPTVLIGDYTPNASPPSRTSLIADQSSADSCHPLAGPLPAGGCELN